MGVSAEKDSLQGYAEVPTRLLLQQLLTSSFLSDSVMDPCENSEAIGEQQQHRHATWRPSDPRQSHSMVVAAARAATLAVMTNSLLARPSKQFSRKPAL